MTTLIDTFAKSIYRFALKHHRKPADPLVINSYGLTPITLSAKLGRKDVFMEIIDLNTQELWKFGSMVCSVYPLLKLDTIDAFGHTDWTSSLMYIINGTSDDHLDMLEGGVVRQLLNEKWRVFGYKRFIQMLLLMFVYCMVFLLATVLRENLTESQVPYEVATTTNIIRFCLESVSIMLVLFMCSLHIHECKEQGITDFLKGLVNAPLKACFLFSCLLIILCIPLRIIQIFTRKNGPDTDNTYKLALRIEEIFIIFASLLNCFYFLFFTGGFKLTGPFVTMIFKIIKGDLLRFAIIYFVVLVGFTQAFFFLFKDAKASVSTFRTFQGSIMALFQMTFGKFKYEEFKYTRNTTVLLLVFVVFMILVPILLLNMLIAMMGNTYQLVISRSQKEWISMWAKIVITLERTYGPEKLKIYQKEYSIPISNKITKSTDNGIIVITSRKKTLASIRKCAAANWKHFFRKIQNLIRAHKESGKPQLALFEGKDRNSVKLNERLQLKRRQTSSLFAKVAAKSKLTPINNILYENITTNYPKVTRRASVKIRRIPPSQTVEKILLSDARSDVVNTDVNVKEVRSREKPVLPNPKDAFRRLNSS